MMTSSDMKKFFHYIILNDVMMASSQMAYLQLMQQQVTKFPERDDFPNLVIPQTLSSMAPNKEVSYHLSEEEEEKKKKNKAKKEI